MDKTKIILLFLSLTFVFMASTTAQSGNRKVGNFSTTRRRVTSKTTTVKFTTQSFDTNCTLEFETFKVKYFKKYFNSTVEAYHKSIFCKSLKEIHEHNANRSSPFKMAVNGDSDIDPEKNPRSNGLKIDEKTVKESIAKYKVKQMPPAKQTKKVRGTYVNLGNKTGYVKDQGVCGSCWAYAAIAVTQYDALVNGNLNITLSEQDMLDCNEFDGSCDGAAPIAGLAYAYNQGVAAQATYPYRQRKAACKRPNPKIPPRWKPANVCAGQMKGDDRSYPQILDEYGPILLAIAFTGKITSYKGGIYNDAASCGTQVNHGVVMTGYGTDPTFGDYYIIKNSWGPLWGEDGYFRVKAGVNMCGIGLAVFVFCPA